MSQVLWLVLAWVAGTAAILGSLMTLGSFILLFVPSQVRSQKPEKQLPTSQPWQHQLRLLAFSVAIAIAGLGILVVVPFPSF